MSELFGAYTASFLHGLSVYAHVEASVSAQPADTPPPYITLSQRLTADGLPFIAGLAMPADAFYAIAAGYSGVCLDTAEELAVDAAGELFNVINGHFSSRMRTQGHAVSILDPPRHHHGAAEPAAPIFSYDIMGAVGTMRLFAAREEFLSAAAH